MWNIYKTPYNVVLRNAKYVSIIITHYAQADDFGELRAKQGHALPRSQMIRDCIESLAQYTDYPCEVIVIDNGGNPDDSDYLTRKTREGIINTYVRNKNNMHFGWARNQGIALATSEYICICDNDIKFKPNWLSETMKYWLAHRDRKLIATPFITPDKAGPKNDHGVLSDGARLNSMAGSNCMILTKRIYGEVGSFTTNHITGSHWHRRMNELGYLVIAPPRDMVEDMGLGRGYSLKTKIKVQEELLNKEIADFSFQYTK